MYLWRMGRRMGSKCLAGRQGRWWLGAIGALLVLSGQAQTVPDAGALRQGIEQGREPVFPQQAVPEQPAPPATPAAPQGLAVRVTEFQFSGNTLLDSDQLRAVLAGFVQHTLDYNQLQAAAAAVVEAYRQAGWIARVNLPQQDITDGIVTLQVLEAVFGGTRLEGPPPERVNMEQIHKIVDAHQQVGAFLRLDALDRGLIVAGDLPGVRVNGSLRPGLQPGQTDMVLRIIDDVLARGSLSLDNNGARSTGPERLSGELYLNSPLRLGDLISGNLVLSEGSDYLRLGATVPVGYDGWRVGINTAVFHYRLLPAEYAALDAKGSSESVGLEASYSLYRSRLQNLYLFANADHKEFDNRSGPVLTSHYHSNDLSLGISGTLVDQLGGGGNNNASLTLTTGQLNLAGSPSQAIDAASAHTEGGFSKLRYSASRLQVLNDDWTLSANFSGQWADSNLDSSEKFYLGGSTGVRAYPANEAGGANGQMLNLELRRTLAPGLNLSGFYDIGQVQINPHNSFRGAPTQNELLLRGLGLALNWQLSARINVRGSWAQRIAENPNPTVGGNDQDGTRVFDRLWLNASLSF